MIHGLFDLETRLAKIDKNTDPLVRLTAMIDWEQFRPTLQALREKPRKSNAGAKGYAPTIRPVASGPPVIDQEEKTLGRRGKCPDRG